MTDTDKNKFLQCAVHGDPQTLINMIDQVQKESYNEGYIHAVEVLQKEAKKYGLKVIDNDGRNATHSLKNAQETDYEKMLQTLREESADMPTKPVHGGTAIRVHYFNSFCSQHSIQVRKFKKWLHENGFIEFKSRKDNGGVNYTVTVRTGNKTARYVILF